MRSRAQIKQDAKRKLNAYWTVPVFATLLVIFLSALITGLLRDNILSSSLETIVSTIANVFLTMLFLNIAKNDNFDKVQFSWMNVSGLKLLKCLVYSLLMSLGITVIQYVASSLGVLMAAVVSIFVAVLEIYLSFSILAILDTDAPIFNAIKISLNLIEGNFFNTILFGLSFVGWFILGALPFGLGLLWVFPYFSISYANYYLELKNHSKIL
ncbi:DUF975 family protein [Intestinibacter bartlettii]|uniref:DUF975 family protein n=1 Tax=Intestinibacter bartlettii TaxID=261299 RepID=A0ABS6DWN5_9FIRM|nr:DUF975 family protein [Intestinibacter bartlettii]MBU5336263.1 DUF975 family protein [Intestinibacter bartlettii]